MCIRDSDESVRPHRWFPSAWVLWRPYSTEPGHRASVGDQPHALAWRAVPGAKTDSFHRSGADRPDPGPIVRHRLAQFISAQVGAASLVAVIDGRQHHAGIDRRRARSQPEVHVLGIVTV